MVTSGYETKYVAFKCFQNMQECFRKKRLTCVIEYIYSILFLVIEPYQHS